MIDKNNLMEIAFNENPSMQNAELNELSKEATSYLLEFEWCQKVKKLWLARSWDELVVVFLAEIDSHDNQADDEVWIVVGDIPSAYIDIESAFDANEVIECYVSIMNDWVEDVSSGGDGEDCYPIDVPAKKKYARMLATRLDLIKEHVLPS